MIDGKRLLELVALFLARLVLLALIALRPWPSHLRAIGFPRGKVVPVAAVAVAVWASRTLALSRAADRLPA